ncbi:MAG: hypothetical protein L0G99_14715 [Propionibacteriales bacterium]|nr:hypothetical protein [Propionibacteriales bacterium]
MTVRAIRVDRLAADQRADVAWTLAHLTVSDTLITTAVKLAGGGAAAVIDNAMAMNGEHLRTWGAARTHEEQVAALCAQASALITELARHEEAMHAKVVRLRVHDRDGAFIQEEALTWDALIDLRATIHLPGHTERLGAYLGAGSDDPDALRR